MTTENQCTRNDKIEKIEKNIETAKAEHEKLVQYLQGVQNSIIKLEAERTKTIGSINTLNGAFQAYNDSLKILKEEN
jgi:chromosome segregation ATPase